MPEARRCSTRKSKLVGLIGRRPIFRNFAAGKKIVRLKQRMDNNNPHILGTAPIGKLLVQYSLPSIIGMTLTSLYNIIDSIFIGHGVGPLAISGLAITFPLMNLLIAFCTLVGVGGATISSIRLGQRDRKGAEDILGNVVILCVVNAAFYGGVTFLFLDPILRCQRGNAPLCPRLYAGDSSRHASFVYDDRP